MIVEGGDNVLILWTLFVGSASCLVRHHFVISLFCFTIYQPDSATAALALSPVAAHSANMPHLSDAMYIHSWMVSHTSMHLHTWYWKRQCIILSCQDEYYKPQPNHTQFSTVYTRTCLEGRCPGLILSKTVCRNMADTSIWCRRTIMNSALCVDVADYKIKYNKGKINKISFRLILQG